MILASHCNQQLTTQAHQRSQLPLTPKNRLLAAVRMKMQAACRTAYCISNRDVCKECVYAIETSYHIIEISEVVIQYCNQQLALRACQRNHSSLRLKERQQSPVRIDIQFACYIVQCYIMQYVLNPTDCIGLSNMLLLLKCVTFGTDRIAINR